MYLNWIKNLIEKVENKVAQCDVKNEFELKIAKFNKKNLK